MLINTLFRETMLSCKFQSLRDTFNWLRSSLNLILMLHILPTSANETINRETGDNYPVFKKALPGPFSQQKCFTAHRPEETICVYKHDWSSVLFFTLYGWKQKDIFLQIISVFCVYGHTGIVQTSGVFLSLSSKTNAHTGQDLHDSRWYCFCPHGPLQSTQNESFWEEL